MPPSGISIEIPLNGIFRKKSILAYFDDPQYRRKNSGITKYLDMTFRTNKNKYNIY